MKVCVVIQYYSSKKQFGTKKIQLFLQLSDKLCEHHSLLWNPREDTYKMKTRYNDSLKAIATENSAYIKLAKKKFYSLIVQHRWEKNCRKNSGVGSKENKKPWWSLKYFRLLIDKFTLRITFSRTTEPKKERKENNDAMAMDLDDNGEYIYLLNRASSYALSPSECYYNVPPKLITKKR